jgi:hypothetical protein
MGIHVNFLSRPAVLVIVLSNALLVAWAGEIPNGFSSMTNPLLLTETTICRRNEECMSSKCCMQGCCQASVSPCEERRKEILSKILDQF